MYPLSLLHDPWSITDPWRFLWYVAGLLPHFLCLKYVLSEKYIAIIKFYIMTEISWETQNSSQRGWGQWNNVSPVMRRML